MASYAIIGATGNTGHSLIQILLQNPEARVNAYCRNKAKLVRLIPDILDNKRIQIFEGSITDQDKLAQAVRGTRAVFLAVSSNDNIPGCTMAADTARGVLGALKKIRAESPTSKMPKIVPLSSATHDPHLSKSIPGWFQPIMIRAASFVYADLHVQEEMLRAESDWLTSIFIKPGGLAFGPQKGHKLDFDKQESFVGYLDLAAAMVEAADDPDGKYDMRDVSITLPNGGAPFPRGTPMCILCGLLRHFFPFLHEYLPWTGP